MTVVSPELLSTYTARVHYAYHVAPYVYPGRIVVHVSPATESGVPTPRPVAAGRRCGYPCASNASLFAWLRAPYFFSLRFRSIREYRVPLVPSTLRWFFLLHPRRTTS